MALGRLTVTLARIRRPTQLVRPRPLPRKPKDDKTTDGK